MLSDSFHEVRQQAHNALSEFLEEIKNTPVWLLLYMWDVKIYSCSFCSGCDCISIIKFSLSSLEDGLKSL